MAASASGEDAGTNDLNAGMRNIALRTFQHALAEARVGRAFHRNLNCERGVLRICEDLYDLTAYDRVLVISLGKAAHAMVEALHDRAGERFEGIVVGPPVEAHQWRGFQYFHGGHPLPTQESIQAARAVLRSLRALGATSLAIYLLSGGGSSMMEQLIDDELSLDDLVSSYQVLIHSGVPIAEINAIRKHLSAVKGGRLAQAAYPAHQISLLVSDVPDNTPDAVASGPTMPDSTSVDDCYAIAANYGLSDRFPDGVRELFQLRALEETPKTDNTAFHNCRWWTILSNASLVEAAKRQVGQLGFHVEVDNSCDDWDYLRARDYLLVRLRKLQREFGKVCLISGGEVTVKVLEAGIGGRNQHFALACALEIPGQNIAVLSAGSDGIDGNSPAAGAVVDGTTLERGRKRGLNAELFLSSFNSYDFFKSIGDAIVTGPTGNNLRDLRILLAH